MQRPTNHIQYFDSGFDTTEQIPREFTISFEEVAGHETNMVQVKLNNAQLGDVISDNSYINDYYRYHDIFHYTFATMLGWSPCTRTMMKKKRKSNHLIDELEDGARATITEEALSMIIFNEAKRKNYFENANKVSRTTLKIIKEMTENFEVGIRTSKEWEKAILKAYEIFRFLISNKGGTIEFDANKKEIRYFSLN